MVAVGATDIPMNLVSMGGGSDDYQVGVSLVVRYEGRENLNYAVHDDVAEVYYVLEGRGRMRVGGTITDWTRRPYSEGNGRGSRGTTAVGSEEISIKKGDMLIIPAGTPHKWDMADEFTAYVVVRVDPEGVAPLMELGAAEFNYTGTVTLRQLLARSRSGTIGPILVTQGRSSTSRNMTSADMPKEAYDHE